MGVPKVRLCTNKECRSFETRQALFSISINTDYVKKTFLSSVFIKILQKHQEADDNSGAVRRPENLQSQLHVSSAEIVAAL